MARVEERLQAETGLCCAPTDRPVLSDAAAFRFSTVFKALSDPTRVKVVSLLAEVGELCVCDIKANFDLGPSTMSHNLKVLREAGLLRADKRGLWIFYRLEPGALAMLREFAA